MLRNTASSDTRNAFLVTLDGLTDLIPKLLDNGFHFVLPGRLQSDPTEGKFGIYRQESRGNIYISVPQVLPSLRLQRLKLFKKLLIELSNVHRKESCCDTSLDGTKIDCLDNYFEMSSKLIKPVMSSKLPSLI